MTKIWGWQEAKDNLGALVENAEGQEPQIITRRGKQVAVVLSIEAYSRLTKLQTDLVAFFQASPLANGDLDLGRRD